MKLMMSSFILVLFSCNASKATQELKEFPSAEYEVIELNDENFKLNKPYTININAEEQKIGGTFDCNTFSSKYEKDEKTIDFGYAMSTKMYCEGKMANENTFFKSLNKIKNFKYDDEMLEFFDDENKLILKLKRIKS